MEFLKFPKLNNGFLRVWQRNFLQFRKTWLVSFFWITVEPFIYLAGIGYGLGAFVNNMEGLSFLEFFFPGLLCTTAMFVSFFEGTYANFSKLNDRRTYSSMMLTRVGPQEIVFGEILWAATKGFIGVVGVTCISGFLGLVDTPLILLALIVLFIFSWLMSCLAIIVTSYAKSYDAFIYATSGIIIPMALLSGVYFPLERLHWIVRYPVYLLPLTHAVAAVRGLLNQGEAREITLHILFLFVFAWFATSVAIIRIRQRLLK